MATLEELQAKRKELLAKIAKAGGKDKAKGLAKELSTLDGQIRTSRGAAPGGEAAPIQLDKSQEKVVKGVQGGQQMSNILGLDKPLSRLDTNTPEDRQRLIESIKQLSDPSSPAFVGNRSQEEKDSLGTLDKLSQDAQGDDPLETKALAALEASMGSAGVRTQEQTDLMARLKSDSETRGQRTGEMTDNLAALKAKAATAGNRSQEMADTLALMKQGLAGLSAPENQAMREQAQREVDRKQQAAIESVQNAARSTGMRGGSVRAGERNARRDGMMAQADLEQKGLLANIDIQDKRRTAYGDQLSGVENDEFDRGRLSGLDYADALGGAERDENARYSDSINAFRNQLSGVEANEADQRMRATDAYASTATNTAANRFARRTSAADAYSGRVNQLGNAERERTRNALGDYGNALSERDNYFRSAAEANMGQERTEKAAGIQSAFGLAGLTEVERARRRANAANKRRGRGDGRTSGAPATDPNQFGGFASAADQEYYNSVNSIMSGAGR